VQTIKASVVRRRCSARSVPRRSSATAARRPGTTARARRGDIEQVDVASDGTPAQFVPSAGDSGQVSDFVSVSADGRYAVFESDACNLVPGDSNGLRDLFIRATV